MTPDTESISITRGRGGQVEAEGITDPFALAILRRAGFLSDPTVRGSWIRLPFDMGRDWENDRATLAAEILSAAHYPVRLDPALRRETPATVAPCGPGHPPAMTAQTPPPRIPRR